MQWKPTERIMILSVVLLAGFVAYVGTDSLLWSGIWAFAALAAIRGMLKYLEG
jgi:hypothetical protein